MNKKYDKIVLLAKSKLSIHDEFVLLNNVLKEFYDIKVKIRNSNNK